MGRELFWLSSEEWALIEPHLPRGRRGARRVDDQQVISSIIHMLKTGARWRDCPAEYGPYTMIYNRFNRWSKQGVWEDVFYALSGSSRGCQHDGGRLHPRQGAPLDGGGKEGTSSTPSADRAVDGRTEFTP